MAIQILSTKSLSEELTLELDFLSRMSSGESAATAKVSMSVLSGTDASPELMVSGEASVANNIVTQKIIGGVAGNIYLMTVAVRSTLNNIYINQAKIAVLNDTAVLP